MRRIKNYYAMAVGILVLLTASCKIALVPEPSSHNSGKKNPADYPDSIVAPINLAATQGRNTVELSWDALPNAVFYSIYSCDTPFDTFTRIGDSKTNSFTAEESEGTTKYYKVTATNYYNTESSLSTFVTGSTLARPVITNIGSATSGTDLTIQWWMDNCSTETYESEIEFIINTYDEDKKLLSSPAPVTVDSTINSLTVSGLSSNTEYHFEVIAHNKTCNYSLSSGLVNITSAHNILPDPVVDFTAEQGKKTDSLQISWKLPAPVWYYETSGYYSQHPVYFTLLRKESDESDESFATIAAYIGVNSTKENTAKGMYVFNCEDAAACSPNITVDTTTKTDAAVTPGEYGTYSSEVTLNFTDSTAVPGIKYTYKIQSYTDYYAGNKPFTADNTILTTEGWLLSPANFSISATYETEESVITKYNLSYNASFDSLGNDYSYVITKETFAITDITQQKEAEAVFAVYNSIEEINAAESSIIPSSEADNNNEGYYFYNLYIVDYDENLSVTSPVPSSWLIKAAAPGNITVTTSAERIPHLEENEVQILDGYKDKFIIKWPHINKLNDFIEYTVNYIPYINNTPQAPVSVVLSEVDNEDGTYYTDDGTTVVYECPAVSGDCRKFTITANTGCSKTVTKDTVYKTLGTAKPVMADVDYSEIKVSWNEVQKADTTYTVSAYYTDDETKAELCLLSGDEPNTQVETVNNVITCNFKPEGYNNINVAGKEITFKVTAKNSATGDETTATIPVKNMGPALLDTKVVPNPADADSVLRIKWNEIEGAKGYIIYRPRYSYSSGWKFDRADKYFYDVSKQELSVSSEAVDSKRAQVIKNNQVYTLVDRYCEADDTTKAYEINQAHLKWGEKFGYVVLPVINGEEDFVFGDEADYLKTTEDSAVEYSTDFSTKEVCQATYGYGLNVSADKAESAQAIKVTWDQPYITGLVPTVYRKRFAQQENSSYPWTKVATLAANITEYNDTIDSENIAKAFVYAVQYEAPDFSSFAASYTGNLLKVKDDRYFDLSTEDSAEQLNKGYLLTLDNFEAIYGGVGTSKGDSAYYQENVSWNTIWDYDERKLGPDSFQIAVKNRNLSSTMNWLTIAQGTVSEGLSVVTSIETLAAEYDTIIEATATNNGLTLKPKGLTDNTAKVTNGLLKVLRDAKHYYSVSLTRGDVNVRQAEDNSIYTYRQITDEELCRCVGLIIADSLYKCGVPNRKTYSTSGHTGDFKLACSTGTTDANRVQWQCSDYTNKFTKANSADDMGSLNSFITLNSATSSFESKGIYGETLYYLPDLEIEVKCDDDIKLSTYSGTVKFTAGGCSWSLFSTPSDLKRNLTMYLNSSKVISISDDETAMYEYFPYDLGTKHENPDATINTSLQTYQGNWWN